MAGKKATFTFNLVVDVKFDKNTSQDEHILIYQHMLRKAHYSFDYHVPGVEITAVELKTSRVI